MAACSIKTRKGLEEDSPCSVHIHTPHFRHDGLHRGFLSDVQGFLQTDQYLSGRVSEECACLVAENVAYAINPSRS